MQRHAAIHPPECQRLPAPAEMHALLPRSRTQAATVDRSRRTIRDILAGRDPRLLAIVGPCSIHDLAGGREYGRRLAGMARELEDRLVLVMRAYFEKPRTGTGWQGLVLDPGLDGSGDIAAGLRLARGFLGELLDLGLPTATEFLDPISPPYLADLVCWAAVGARNAESQLLRQIASGLDLPLGFKNGTDGTLEGAINGILAAAERQVFLGITADGRAAAVRTGGNPDCHLVLRGGASGPNYSAANVARAVARLDAAGLPRTVMVDCSHDNSGRQPERQPGILADVVGQVLANDLTIRGVMLESYLAGGRQAPVPPRENLRYGVSITDPCLDWPSTEQCLRATHAALAAARSAAEPTGLHSSTRAERAGPLTRVAWAGAGTPARS